MSEKNNQIQASKQKPEERGVRLSRLRTLGSALLAIFLYLLLLDAAIETFLSGSTLRWIVGGTVAGYIVLNVLFWRRMGWETKSSVSLIVLLGLLAATAWLPGGLTQGVALLRQPTSTVLSAVTALGILLAGWVLVRVKFLPLPARAALGLLGAYGVAAFAMGIVRDIPYAVLLRGGSLWEKAPFWLQGAFIGAVVLVPAALLSQIIIGMSRIRSGQLHAWGRQVLVFSLSLVMAVVGFTVPAGSPPSTAEPPTNTSIAAQQPQPIASPEAEQPSTKRESVNQSREQIVARLERLYQALEAAHKELPRDSFDPRAVVDQVGDDPIKLYQWVRDNTYWVPYQGSLRGPVGVLMDRLGNSLDRALLLAELLHLGGQEVRLARGPINDKKALKLLAAIRQVPLAPQAMPPVADRKSIQNHVDKQVTETMVPREQIGSVLREAEQSAKKTEKVIAGQMTMLAAAVPDPRREDVTRQADELAAISDHWWVQMRKEGNWLDMDLLDRTAKAGETVTAATQTMPLQEVDPKLFHEVRIKVLAERWRKGKLSEELAMEHTLQPAQLIGQRIALSFIPLKWPEGGEGQAGKSSVEELKARAMMVKEWLPVLEVGDRRTAQASFTDSGEVKREPGVDDASGGGRTAGGLLGEMGGGELSGDPTSKEKEGQLSAVWLDFELHSPGRPPQKIRREVMDVLGPAARASGKYGLRELPESLRFERALALLSEVEILPLVSDLSPEFITDLGVQVLLANRDAFLGIAALEKAPGEEDLVKVVGALTSMPGALHLLALGRRGVSRVRAERFLDRPNILCFFTRPKSGGPNRLLRQVIVDIVNNDVAVRPGASASPYRMRLQQGIVDTVVEGMILSPEENAENTADLFARVEAQGKGVIVVRKKGDQGWRKLEVGDDARARMEEDLRAGYVIVSPATPIEINGRPRLGWWRVHPVSGETLGVMESGFHQGMTDTAISKTHVPMRMVAVARRARALGHGGLMSIYAWILRYLHDGLQRLLDFAWREGMRPGDPTYYEILRLKLAIMESMMKHPWFNR